VRLVVVTQRVDARDPVLGATVAKLRALARQCEKVHVLALAEREHNLPPNVTISTFGGPRRTARGLRYMRALAGAVVRRPDALLVHMAPIYLVLAAPLAKPLGVPLLLWYTHWSATGTLRTATRLADAVLSVDETSFPLRTPKLSGIGHGIDVDEFAPRTRAHEGRMRVGALGRTSPTKGLATIVEGFRLAVERGLDATLELRGASTTEAERRYRRELETLIARHGLGGRVSLEPAVPRTDVPSLLSHFDAVVNAHEGTLDKVVYEGAAGGIPVVACSPGFERLLGELPVELRFPCGDPHGLAETLLALAASPPAARLATGQELRRRVERAHSTETWATGVAAAVREARASSRPAYTS
jgi:glycosyltransferase involved in cell wall biosynthesis